MNRPKFHFTPQENWINDPNGPVYIDGEYHLFYQHYPEDVVWGPMHWGHAVSRDLLQWEHKKIALYPDELGYIFSGSCIYDKENVSGLGTEKNPPLIAFFTHHNPENGRQQQSIAYSLDKEHFVKYEANPVIPNTQKKDFRDPKVFENPIRGGYTMAVAAGYAVEFYHSDNLLDWEYTGSFIPGSGGNGYSGICECPDCFPMETVEGTKWVLLISMCLSEEDVYKTVEAGSYASAHMMQYYIGEFDGDTFVDTVCAGEPLFFEYGPDNYAAVTFSGCKEHILIGWGENWNYIKEMPPVEEWTEKGELVSRYRGKMTLARKLALSDTRFGYRLKSEPLGELSGKFVECEKECEVVYSNTLGEHLVIRMDEERIIVDRSDCGVKRRQYDVFRSPRYKQDGSRMRIIQDEGYFEIYAEDGLAVFSVMTYPQEPFTECTVKNKSK